MAYYGKDLRVNLAFQADISAAAANIQQLGKLLEQVATKTTIGIDQGPLQEATTAARQLQTHLQNALNVKTGQLNLNKLNSSLKSAGTDLQTLSLKLQNAGATGQQAFIKLANAVANAETPMLNVNKRLSDFTNTLGNTVKWQLATTAVQTVSKSLSGAVTHAENLNKALNEIRIVTGYSMDSMAKFTVQAREAASALSSTTTDYAKAALIFYQQGLTGKDVLERANTVIKLSNVTGQTAEIVSEQMTAIWNNFDDGSKSIEYYADAIAKLGAATASSTDEIAEGLQKFAAIADTIGLSYEYATAALATMTSETREAAVIVGNSLKTIFARMESLKLGETLDDGVTLNKYSQALKTVGVDILDYRGNLKDMDTILDDLSSKWKGIGETQQVALAQTVGGVQQYARFISLMETWDKTKENVELVNKSEGSLDEQQRIWSEGWEAASKRVQQNTSELYENLVNDKSITVLTDSFASLIKSIDRAIDSMHGLLPMILKLSAVFGKQLFPVVQKAFGGMIENIKYVFGDSKREILETQNMMQSLLNSSINDDISKDLADQLRLSRDLIKVKQDLAAASKYMTIAEQEEAQRRIESYEATAMQAQASLSRKIALEQELNATKDLLNTKENRAAFSKKDVLDRFREKIAEKNKTRPEDQQLNAEQMIRTAIYGGDLEARQAQIDATQGQRIEEATQLTRDKQARKTTIHDAAQRDQAVKEEKARQAEIEKLDKQIQKLEERKAKNSTTLTQIEAEEAAREADALRKAAEKAKQDREKNQQKILETRRKLTGLDTIREAREAQAQAKKNEDLDRREEKATATLETAKSDLAGLDDKLWNKLGVKVAKPTAQQEVRRYKMSAKMQNMMENLTRDDAAIGATMAENADKRYGQFTSSMERSELTHARSQSKRKEEDREAAQQYHDQMEDIRFDNAVRSEAFATQKSQRNRDNAVDRTLGTLIMMEDEAAMDEKLFSYLEDRTYDEIIAERDAEQKRLGDLIDNATNELTKIEQERQQTAELSPVQKTQYEAKKQELEEQLQFYQNQQRKLAAISPKIEQSQYSQTKLQNRKDNIEEDNQAIDREIKALQAEKAELEKITPQQTAQLSQRQETDYAKQQEELNQKINGIGDKIRAQDARRKEDLQDMIDLQKELNLETERSVDIREMEVGTAKTAFQAVVGREKIEQYSGSIDDNGSYVFELGEEDRKRFDEEVIKPQLNYLVGAFNKIRTTFDDESAVDIQVPKDGNMPFSATITIDNYDKVNALAGEFKAIRSQTLQVEKDVEIIQKKELEAIDKKLDKAKLEIRWARTSKEREAAEKRYNELLKQRDGIFENLRARMNQLQQSAGANEDSMEAFNAALDAVKDDPSNFEPLITQMTHFKLAVQGTSDALDSLVFQMEQELSKALSDQPEAWQALKRQAQELKEISYQNTNNQANANRERSNIDLGVSDTQIKQDALGDLNSIVGSIVMVNDAFHNMFQLIDEGASAVDVLTAGLTSFTMLLPMIANGLNIIRDAKAAQLILDQAQIEINSKLTLSRMIEIATQNKEKTSLTGLIMVKLLHNKVALAAIAIAAALVVAATLIIQAHQKRIEKLREENQRMIENAQHSEELVDSWQNQAAAMDNLIAKYKELKAAGEDYQNTAQDIIGQSGEMVEAFKQMGEELNLDGADEATFNKLLNNLKVAASGTDEENILAMEQAIAELNKFISSQGLKQTWAGLEGAVGDMALDLDEWKGSFKDGKYTVHIGGFGGGEITAVNLLAPLDSVIADTNSMGADITLDTSDPEEFIRQYEELQNGAQAIRSRFKELGLDLSTSGTYAELTELLDAAKESYDEAVAIQKNYSKYKVQDTVDALKNKGNSVSNISSVQELRDYREALGGQFKEGSAGQEAALDWLGANEAVQDYIEAEEDIIFAANQIRNAASLGSVEEQEQAEKDAKALEDRLIALHDDLSPEARELFLDINFNTFQSDEAIRAEIDRLQSVADMKKIDVTLAAIDDAQSALKDSGMNEEDWTKLRESINWGEDGIISFNDFLSKSYAEQSQYLEQLKADYSDAYNEIGSSSLEEQRAALAALEASKAAGTYTESDERYQEERQGILDSIAALEDLLSLRERIAEMEELENMGLDPGEVQEYAEALATANDEADGISEDLYGNEKAAKTVAVANSRMNKGLEDLGENFEDLSKVLKNSKKGTAEYNRALKDLDEIMSDVLNLDVGTLSDDFLTSADNLKLMEKAAEGDTDAIESLRAAAATDIIQHCDVYLTGDDEVRAKLDQLSAELAAYAINNKLEIGAYVDDTQFIAACNEMIQAAGMTAQQAGEYFKALGYDAEVDWETQTQEPRTEYITETGFMTGPDGIKVPVNNKITRTYGAQTVTVPVIKALTYTGSAGGTVNFSNTKAGKKGSGGGGGGSKKQKAEEVKKSDVVERYKEINDSLDDVADAMEDAAKSADRLYGDSRLQQMQKQNKILKDEIELLKEKKKQALAYLDEDRIAVGQAAKEAGVMINFDENGLISNYIEAMTELYEELDAAITKANRDGNATESEQAVIDKIQERIDKLSEAIGQYDETRELIEDLDNEMDDKFYEWQDRNYEMLSYKLELQLEINDLELEKIEYYLKKLEDDFYKMAEAAALMAGGGADQLNTYLTELSQYEEQMRSLDAAYANGEISQADYVEGLKEVQSGLYDNLNSLLELDDAMMEYYGETIAAAGEEIAKFTDQMEHATAVLEHYQSIMDTLGKSNDYKTMSIILEAQTKVLENEVEAAKASMEMYKEQADARYAEYQQALADGDQAAAELYLAQYEAALEAANEAEDNYLSKANEWAEALRAVLENKLADLGQSLENALTGGTSFDQMTTALERAASLQEEYLTTTNKIYETNKLMRTAQKALDETTNTVAKRRLQGFIDETQQLQDQAELSQYELEIQQAKYDLLLAEIALEEAQNAKSTVRLQRDSEGNYGYVYTADSAQVAQAEQELADAQNRLYNIALEGANSYTEKYQQTLSEMYDTLTDLQEQYLEGAFESEEEYHAAVEAAKEYYYEKLKQYSSLYTVAVTTDSRVIADAWSTDFADMTYQTEDWMYAVEEYLGQVEEAFVWWHEQVAKITEMTGTDLDSLEQNVQDIVDKTNDLTEALVGENGVISAIEAELDAVAKITESYATLRSTLDSIIKKYEELAEAAIAAVTAQQRVSNSTPSNNTSYNKGSAGGSGNAGAGANIGGGSGSGGGGSSGGGGGSNNTKATETVNVYTGLNRRYLQGSIVITKGIHSLGEKVYDSDDFTDAFRQIYGLNKTLFVRETDALKLEAKGFDTGGYTGKWGPGGKLALLHEKELVLNKDDTSNFLASMELLNHIIEALDLRSANAQLGGLLTTPYFGNLSNGILEQQVHIEANFPNATDKYEIEEAFYSLVNLASQYGNRK